MAIKELTTKTLGKQKTGWRWDRKREIYVTWQVDTTFRGERHIRRGFRSEQAAKDYIADLKMQDRLKEIGFAVPIKFPLVQELFDKHTAVAETISENVRRKRVFAEFQKLLPVNARINEIERKHIKDYCDQRIKDGIKEETANREITCIASALHKASDYFTGLEKWIPPKVYRPKVTDEGRERVLSRDERDLLIPYLLRDQEQSEKPLEYFDRRRAGLILYFGLLSGLRHGEICRLEKTNYNLRERKLLVERFKTKKTGVR